MYRTQAAKKADILRVLSNPDNQNLSHAAVARMANVSESMVSRYRQKANKEKSKTVAEVVDIDQEEDFQEKVEPTYSTQIQPFSPRQIEQGNQVLFDARDIHEYVQSKQQFANWIQKRISEIGAVEGVDYLINKFIKQVNGQGRQVTEYYVTPEMGQELGMLERNAIGHHIRQWFIERNRKLQEVELSEFVPPSNQYIPDTDPVIMEALPDATSRAAYKLRIQALRLVAENRPDASTRSLKLQEFRINALVLNRNDIVEEYQPQLACPVVGWPKKFTAESIAKNLGNGISAKNVNSLWLCQSLGLLEGEPGNWKLTARGREYGEIQNTIAKNNGRPCVIAFWDERVISMIRNAIDNSELEI